MIYLLFFSLITILLKWPKFLNCRRFMLGRVSRYRMIVMRLRDFVLSPAYVPSRGTCVQCIFKKMRASAKQICSRQQDAGTAVVHAERRAQTGLQINKIINK